MVRSRVSRPWWRAPRASSRLLTYIVDDKQPIIIIGPSRWPDPDNSIAQNLTIDGVAGSNSVTVVSANGFKPGQFVLIDELSGMTWQPVLAGFGCSGCTVRQSDRVAYNIHNPTQSHDDSEVSKSWFSRTDRPTNEIKEIASVSGSTITFTSPLGGCKPRFSPIVPASSGSWYRAASVRAFTLP
jgi:hypothetical protein